MQRQTPVDTAIRGYVSGGARGLVHKADDKQQMQELKVNFLRNETREKVEHPQNYGFTSYCKEADYDGGGNGGGEMPQSEKQIKKSAEHFAQFMGGARSFPVVQNLDDRRFRCRNFDEGEVAMYVDQQQKVHIMRERIYTRSPFTIAHGIIKDEPEEDGHGRDPKASRDQKKDESKRLSTVALDKDTILIARTKPKDDGGGQQKQQREPGQDDDYQNDEPEKEYKKPPEVETLTEGKFTEKKITLTVFRKGQPFLVFDMDEETSLIQMQTLREDKPHIQFTLDGENGEVSIGSAPSENKPNLIWEMNDEERKIRIGTEDDGKEKLIMEFDHNREKITIKTDEKTKIEMDNRQGNITIKVENKLKLGDENAQKKAAMEGSIDSNGDRMIGQLSKKVLVAD